MAFPDTVARLHDALTMVYPTDAAESAAMEGRDDLVKKYHDLYPSIDINRVAAAAATNDHAVVVRMCLNELGADNVAWILNVATEYNSEKVLCVLSESPKRVKLTTNDVNHAMLQAATNGYTGAVKLCHDALGGTDVNGALRTAAANGNANVARLCIAELGATDIPQAMALAAQFQNQTSLLPVWEQYADVIAVGDR